MKPVGRKYWRWMGIGVAVMALVIGGCAGSKIKGEGSAPSAQKDNGPVPLYYDFGDVLVPSELKVDKDASFVFRTPGYSAGVLALTGRVEVNSLIDFFYNNMSKDNWKLISYFKSRRTLMLFNKENRWCAINITEGDFTTYAEIWVSPTAMEGATGKGTGVGSSGLLK
ncbi:MAG: hypothetical protein AB1427_05105 [Thermodesulfobacteriota bacterium]